MAAVTKRRIALLDEIRGFCIICMVFYHAFFLFGSFGGVAFCDMLYRFFEPVQLLFASAFICISGICTNFSRSPLRRGFLLLLIALGISAATIILLPKLGFDGMQDRFGILHLLGVCMVLSAVLRRLPEKLTPVTEIILCIVLYALSSFLLYGRISLSTALTETPFLFPLGLHGADFYSADYFPLLPHAFIFFIGVNIGKVISERTLSDNEYRTRVRIFAFFGRHSLLVYLAHVPCLLIILTIMERI